MFQSAGTIWLLSTFFPNFTLQLTSVFCCLVRTLNIRLQNPSGGETPKRTSLQWLGGWVTVAEKRRGVEGLAVGVHETIATTWMGIEMAPDPEKPSPSKPFKQFLGLGYIRIQLENLRVAG